MAVADIKTAEIVKENGLHGYGRGAGGARSGH